MRERHMSFGWIDPDSVRMDGEDVVASFVPAQGRTQKLRMTTDIAAKKLVGALDAQEKLGVIYFDAASPYLNAAEKIAGTVEPKNRKSGRLSSDDGLVIDITLPDSAFENVEQHKVSGVAVIKDGEANFFVARVGPHPETSLIPGP